MMKLARKRNVGQATINRAVTEDLETATCSMPAWEQSGLENAQSFSTISKTRKEAFVFFVDEKQLNVDEVANPQKQSVYWL